MEKRNHVLIIEDDLVTATFIQKILAQEACSSCIAEDLRTATARIAENRPAIIISDLNLGSEQAFPFLEALRKSPTIPFIPVIILSGRIELADVISGLSVAEDYLRKPVSAGEILARVRAQLRLLEYRQELDTLNRELEGRVEQKTLQLEMEVARRIRSEGEVRKLYHHLMGVVSGERSRLARELHDVLGSSLLTLKIYIQKAFQELDQASNPYLEEILLLLGGIIGDTRSLAGAVAPVSLQRLGLSAALRKAVADLERLHPHIQFSLQCSGEIVLLPAVAAEIYWIVQEALLNAIKHSHCSVLDIQLMYADDLRLLVKDNGQGFNMDGVGPGLGLGIMRERAASIGGYLEIKSGPAAGTAVTLLYEEKKANESGK